MEALSRSIRNIFAQMRTLTATSRLLIASLLVIAVMTLFLVALYAGRPQMAPLPIDVAGEARTRAISYLETAGIDYNDEGGRILVPTEQRYTILSRLTSEQIITGEQIDFDTIFADESPFSSERDKNRRYLIAKMKVLERMIGGMQGVRSASVLIDEPNRRTPLGEPDMAPSASVTVQMVTGDLDQARVDAIANLVAGAHASLRPERVRVVDAAKGVAMHVRSADDMVGTKYLETKQAAERHVRAKLERYLDYIPQVRVEVNAQVDASRVESRQDSFDDPKVGPLGESSRNYSASNVLPAAEPGVRPNTGGVTIASSPSGSEVRDERSDARLHPVFPGRIEHILDPRGYAVKVSVAIGVPHSYFLEIWKRQQGGDGDGGGDAEAPNDAALQPIITAEIDRIRANVQPLIETDALTGASPGTVQVSMYHDFALAGFGGGLGLDGGEGGAGDGGGGLMGGGLAGNLVRYVGLSGLALLSLAMMFMMVRRANVRDELPTAEELVGIPPALRSDVDLVGEAEETSTPMEGIEVEDGTLKRQQMLAQINEMAQQAPSDAASLLRKWIKTPI